MEKFGERLKFLRTERKLSINQLAKASGVSPSLISRIEKGERGTPKPETIEKLSKALRVEYEGLMGLAGYIQFTDNSSERLLFVSEKHDAHSPVINNAADIASGFLHIDNEGIVKKYNALSPENKKTIDTLIEALFNQQAQKDGE